MDTHESQGETSKKEFEISNHSKRATTNTTITLTLTSQEEQQIEHSTMHKIQENELDGIENIAIKTMLLEKGVCKLNISSIKYDFDLNKGFIIDEIDQDGTIVCSTPTSMIVTLCSAPKTPILNLNGLEALILVAIKDKGPLMSHFLQPSN